MIKKIILACHLSLILCGIGNWFWQSELKYSLLTPVPQSYHQAKTGTLISLRDKLNANGKKTDEYSFCPDCPYPRFIIPHFGSLVKKYGDRIDFAAVVMSKEPDFIPVEIKNDSAAMTIKALVQEKSNYMV